MKNKNECILGIDFGTIASCAAVYYNNKIEVIQDENGKRVIPSVVCYTKDNKVLVGENADKNKIEYVQSTIFECKRFIGHLYNDEHIKRDINKYAVKIIEDPDKKKPQYEMKIGNQIVKKFPSEVALEIIKYIKKISELHIKKVFNQDVIIKKAVITVPFHLTEFRQNQMLKIANAARLEEIDVIKESEAAGIAYGYYRQNKIDENILLFDIGGGTCGVSVLSLKKNNEIKLLGTDGKGHAGGENFEEKLRDFIKDKIKEKEEFKKLDFRKTDKATLRAITKIKDKTQNVISQLSNDKDALFTIADLYEGKDFELKITRDKYMELCKELLNKCYEACTKALTKSKINSDNITKIVLSGGSSRTPGLQDYLIKKFRNATFSQEINADEACAQGAALFRSDLVKIISNNAKI